MGCVERGKGQRSGHRADIGVAENKRATQLDAESLRAAAMTSKAWPYEEARKLLKRWPDGKPGGEPMLFETGYGPSGLPHIGTFNEVLRTTFVRHAYEELTGGAPTRLIAFSDDMDGLRKVPDNVPNAEMLGRTSRQAADPHPRPVRHARKLRRTTIMRCCAISSTASASTMNSSRRPTATPAAASTRRSATSCAIGTRSSASCCRPCARSAARPIRRCCRSRRSTGRVLQVPVEVVDAEPALIAFTDEDGTRIEQSALGGLAKLQWKVDWAMRWVALGVDYEMSGKDLIDSVTQSGKIARVLGGRPPEGFNYEMFLDEKGEKISKSKGNGLSLEEWLTYGSEESLAFYIYREPKQAPRACTSASSRARSTNIGSSAAIIADQPIEQKLGNPVHHIHDGKVPEATLPLTYGLLLNLASLPGCGDKRHRVEVRPALRARHVARNPSRARRADRPRGQLRPRFRRPDAAAPRPRRATKPPRCATSTPSSRSCPPTPTPTPSRTSSSRSASATRSRACATGSRRSTKPCSARRQGPRMGSFIALYGIDNSRRLIAEALAAAGGFLASHKVAKVSSERAALA